MVRTGGYYPICRQPGQRHIADDRFGENLHSGRVHSGRPPAPIRLRRWPAVASYSPPSPGIESGRSYGNGLTARLRRATCGAGGT